jgi:transposase
LTTLDIYKNRDVLDKSSDILKHLENQKVRNFHRDESYDSLVFISFISMILIARIHKVMKENIIFKDKTMEEVLEDLSNIKAIIINGEYIIDQFTRLTKEYLDSFKCPYPK